MRNRPRKSIKIEGLTFDHTSSLNKFFLCECGRKYVNKSALVKHIVKCTGPVTHFCHWCKLTFKTRGNLVLHAKYIHGDGSYQITDTKEKKFQCNVCEAGYSAMWKLKYHIRRAHYNLLAGTPLYQTQQVNQVWCERVLNSDNIVEIKKTGPNKLILTPVTANNNIKLETQTDQIDLHSVYPTGDRKRKSTTTCNICKKPYQSRDLKKHIQETHQKDFYRHKCNNCGMTFKRSYIFLKHVCFKARKKWRVKGAVHCKNRQGLKITNVSSLRPVEVD